MLLNGLEKGQWVRTGAKDASPGHEAAFEAWLSQKYLSMDTEAPPEFPENDLPMNTFLSLTEEQRTIDYNDFLSQQTV
jgi:hypothetical protein